jgi:hypothetical protein
MSPRRRNLLAFFLCFAVAAVWSWVLRENRNDDAYITYRHAQNLLAGHGFVFNPGERVLGTTAPFHGLAIAAMGLVSSDLVVDALVLSCLATAWLGYFIFRVFDHIEAPVAGGVAAATVLFALLTYEVAPLETVLVTALCWGVLRAHQTRRDLLAGVLAGLAVGVRADAGLWVLLIAAAAFHERRDLKALLRTGGVAAFVVAPWFVFAFIYYGQPLPATAGVKSGWPGHTWTFVSMFWDRAMARMLAGEALTWLGAGLTVIGAVVIFRRPKYRELRVVLLWIVAYLAAYSALRIWWGYHWYYFPLVVALAVPFAVGGVESVSYLVQRASSEGSAKKLRVLAIVVSLAAVGADVVEILDYRARIHEKFFVGGRDRLYQQAAQWLRTNTASDTVVALAEPGTIAYYSDRSMVDMLGLITPEAGAERKRLRSKGVSMKGLLSHYAPEVIIINRRADESLPRLLPGAPDFVLQQAFSLEKVELAVVIYARSTLRPSEVAE